MIIEGAEEISRFNNLEQEVKVVDISVGNARTESNVHGISRLEDNDLEETMRSLKMKVLDFKDDNDRLVKEKQQLNTQIL